MGPLTAHVIYILLVSSKAFGFRYDLCSPLLLDFPFLYPLIDSPANLFYILYVLKNGEIRTRACAGGDIRVFQPIATRAPAMTT